MTQLWTAKCLILQTSGKGHSSVQTNSVRQTTHRQSALTFHVASEFDKNYPPDAFGDEMADSARVWKVYRKEANVHDAALLDGWSSTLDILLIFVSNLFNCITSH